MSLSYVLKLWVSPVKKIKMYSILTTRQSIFRRGNWGMERLNNLIKVGQEVAEYQTQAICLHCPTPTPKHPVHSSDNLSAFPAVPSTKPWDPATPWTSMLLNSVWFQGVQGLDSRTSSAATDHNETGDCSPYLKEAVGEIKISKVLLMRSQMEMRNVLLDNREKANLVIKWQKICWTVHFIVFCER